MSLAKKVMISSTVLDLQSHRERVKDACFRSEFFPKMMESLPARDARAVKVSLEMVDDAEAYIIILAWRYGYVPPGSEISVTEMEFNRAVDRGIPILVFVASRTHPIDSDVVEPDASAQEKLSALKNRASNGRIRCTFDSPDDLKAKVIQSLFDLRLRSLEVERPQETYQLSIPQHPLPFRPHPYALLDAARLVGRGKELAQMDEWWNSGSADSTAPLLVITGIGGAGKSALSWTWYMSFTTSRTLNAGSMWWSFYEPGATFDAFVFNALLYFGGETADSIRPLTRDERLEQLIALLDKGPNLLVLDGLERLLIAYTRPDAAYLSEIGSKGLGETTSCRDASEFRVGRFLKRLALSRGVKTVVTSRLVPKDLEKISGEPISGCRFISLSELRDEECVQLWNSMGCHGSARPLIETFNSFGKHPLLIRALAATVCRFRAGPGDFDAWLRENADLVPPRLQSVELVQAKILKTALDALPAKCWPVLSTLALLRMPVDYHVLAEIHASPRSPETEALFDNTLTELEDRGLMGWNRLANQYDLHPVVRGFVYDRLLPDAKKQTLDSLAEHFRPGPTIPAAIASKADMVKPVELFNILTQLGRFNDAYRLLCNQRYEKGLYRYFTGRECVTLLSMLFPKGIANEAGLEKRSHRATALCMLSNAYRLCGDPRSGEMAVEKQMELLIQDGDREEVVGGQTRLSWFYWQNGRFRDAQAVGAKAAIDAHSLNDSYRIARAVEILTITLATCGNRPAALQALAIGQRCGGREEIASWKVVSAFVFALMSDWKSCEAEVRGSKNMTDSNEEDEYSTFERALYGEAHLELGNYAEAERTLLCLLENVRNENRSIEECNIVADLARIKLARGETLNARTILEDIWPILSIAHTPIETTKAFLVLSAIEKRDGNIHAAITAANTALETACCGGPGYSYFRGQMNATAVLADLGVNPPSIDHTPAKDPSVDSFFGLWRRR